MPWHTAKKGETVSSIAKKYKKKLRLQISVKDFSEIIKKYNPGTLNPPKYTVHPNTLILIPKGGLMTCPKKSRLVCKPIPFKIKVDEIFFKNNHPIHDITAPQWVAGGDKHPVCYTKGSRVKMDVSLKVTPVLAVKQKIYLKVDGPGGFSGQKDNVEIEAGKKYCRVSDIETSPLPNKIKKFYYNFKWSFAIEPPPPYRMNWKPAGKTGTHVIYTIYGAPQCGSSNFTKSHLRDAVKWGWNKTTEADIAKRVCWNVSGEVSTGCVCKSTSRRYNPSFDYHWKGARGSNRGGHRDGMCCCRAYGMILVLKVLGVGTYIQEYVNELSEPNTLHQVWAARCSDRSCRGIDYTRMGWGGNIYNNWQGVCKKADGEICYSPQGRHISKYDKMNDAPDYIHDTPKQQPFDRIHAFEHYAWVYCTSYSGSGHCSNWQRCSHLSKP